MPAIQIYVLKMATRSFRASCRFHAAVDGRTRSPVIITDLWNLCVDLIVSVVIYNRREYQKASCFNFLFVSVIDLVGNRDRSTFNIDNIAIFRKLIFRGGHS